MQQVDIPTSKLPIILVCILRQLEKLSEMAGADWSMIVDLTLYFSCLNACVMITLRCNFEGRPQSLTPLIRNVPEEVIRRRFAHGIRNFERYKLLVDSWQLYDNSDIPTILIAEGQN